MADAPSHSDLTASSTPRKPSRGAGRPASPRWNFAAAFLGWLLPGLGHFILGQPQRAVVLGTTIGTLWLTGLLIGGISVIDRTDHPAWFLGQMLIAPSFVANEYRQRLVAEQTAADRSFDPQDNPPFEPAFARAHEQGILFTSLAGLLNLLAMIDVLYRDPRDERDAAAERPAAAPKPQPHGGAA